MSLCLQKILYKLVTNIIGLCIAFAVGEEEFGSQQLDEVVNINIWLLNGTMDITFSFGWLMIGDDRLMLGLFVKLILDGVNGN